MTAVLDIPDRVKLPFRYDVAAMMSDIAALKLGTFIYYDSLVLRGPAHMVDPSRDIPPPADDYADGSWTDWLNTQHLERMPYILNLVRDLQSHVTVNLVRLLRLAPGAEVKEHNDPTLGLQVERSMVRLTVPILSDDQTPFYLAGTAVDMKPGDCWYLRLTEPHKVFNHHAAQERINLTLDIVPNAWFRKMIEKSIRP